MLLTDQQINNRIILSTLFAEIFSVVFENPSRSLFSAVLSRHATNSPPFTLRPEVLRH